jgi:hypothetical protein
VASGVPSWATPAVASSGLTLISTQTAASVATFAFDNVFTSTYNNYLIAYHNVRGVSSTPTVDLYLQLRFAGPTTAATAYITTLSGVNSSSGAINVGATGATQATLSRNIGSSSGYLNQGQMFINGVESTATGNVTGTGQNFDPYGEESLATGFYQGSSRAYLGFIISAASGNFSGTFSLYGLAK